MLLKQATNPRNVMRAAMACLALSAALPIIARHTPDFWTGAIDGARGTLIGAAIALIAIFFRRRGMEKK